MRRWIAALAAEQIGNNQTLFQDSALLYWNGFHRCKANITLRSSPMVCSQPAARRSCSRMRGCICLAAWYGNIALLPSWGQPREFGWDHHGRENHLYYFLIKEALIKSARAASERFCFLRKFGESRNTLCISDFPNCTEGAKDPLLSRRRFIQRFLKIFDFNQEGIA